MRHFYIWADFFHASWENKVRSSVNQVNTGNV